jgi:iron complex outermembrane receptor protein
MKATSRPVSFAAACILSGIVLISATAQAQKKDGLLEEIVVTAQKREQSANDVGISMTALSGDLLQSLGVETVNKLTEFVPNLSIKNQFGGDQAVFDIRGVALFSYDTASSAPVATYVDGVVLPYPSMTQGQLFDIERVEVLRGPQGTLFGKNTTGGAVSFITRGATDTFEAGVSADLGNYKYTKLEAYLSGPLSETFGARLAVVNVRQKEGFQTDVVTGDDVGGINRSGARLTLNWKPTETLDFDLKLRAGRDKSENYGMKILETYTETFSDPDPNNWFVVTPDFHPGHWDTAVSSNVPGFADINPFDKPRKDNKSSGGSLNINWDFGPALFTSVTGYYSLDRVNQMDWDGTPMPINDYSFTSDMSAWSQEFRVSSTGGGPFTWMLGAYFAGDEVDEKVRYDCTASDICLNLAYGVNYVQKASTDALFAHTEWAFSENWKLTFGLRYTKEDRSVEGLVTTVDADPFGVAEFFGYPVGPGSLTGFLADDFSAGVGILECLVLGVCPSYGPPIDSKIKDDAWSGKIGLDWIVSDNVLVYGHISTGFKSGGYGSFPATTVEQWIPYDSETLTAYELGFKWTLAEGRVQLNASTYYYDYEDRQVFSGVPDLIFGPLAAYVNAPKSTLKGFEVELNWAPADGWDIRQAIGYADGQFDEFVDYDNAAVIQAGPDPETGLWLDPIYTDRAGEDAPGTDIQYSGLFAYRWSAGEKMDLRAQLDYSYSDTYTAIYGPDYDLESYWLLNAQFSLLQSEDHWQVDLWGRNLTNEEYFTDKNFYNEASVMGAVGAPRTYGIRFTYNWF